MYIFVGSAIKKKQHTGVVNFRVSLTYLLNGYKTSSTKLSSNVYSMQGLFFETSQLMTTYRLVLPPGIVLQLISKIPAWPLSYDNLRLRAAVCSFLIFFQLKMDWCSLENKCPFCIH